MAKRGRYIKWHEYFKFCPYCGQDINKKMEANRDANEIGERIEHIFFGIEEDKKAMPPWKSISMVISFENGFMASLVCRGEEHSVIFWKK